MQKTIFGVLVSNFTGAGIGFLLNIILARLLSVEEYGRINLVLTMIIVLFTVFEFGFTNSTVVFYNKFKEKYSDIEAFINKLYFNYLLFISLPIIGLVLVLKYFYNLTIVETSVIIVNVLIFSIYRYILAIYQAKAEWKIYNILNIMNNVIKLIILVVFLTVTYCFTNDTNQYDTVLFAYIVSALLLLLISFVVSKPFKKLRFDKNISILSDFKKIILPIGISNIFIIISMRADVFFIENYLGSEQLGIYVAANSLALVFPLITSSLMNVFIQKTSNEKSDFLKKILQTQKKYIPYLILILVASMLITEPLFLILFGENYIASVDIFRILLIAYIGGIFFTPLESYFYSHSQKVILYIKFIQMLFIIIGIWVALEFFTLESVAIVIVLSRVIGWVILYANVKNINSGSI
jgi:O-antigen/teichoic acid export membrane protein